MGKYRQKCNQPTGHLLRATMEYRSRDKGVLEFLGKDGGTSGGFDFERGTEWNYQNLMVRYLSIFKGCIKIHNVIPFTLLHKVLRSLDVSIDLILPAALWPLGRLSL
jgi:hypothetical protein